MTRVVDHLKFTGAHYQPEKFLSSFYDLLYLGGVCKGPGEIEFLGIDTVKHDERTFSEHGDEILSAIVEYMLSCCRRENHD